MTVALGKQGAISLWVGLSPSRIGKLLREQIVHDGVSMHWMKISTCLNIAVSETRFLGVLVQY